MQNDFGIVEERLVFEGRRAYLILAAEPGAAGGPLRLAGLSTEDFYEAGPGLASAGPDVRRFWRGRLERDERWLARASSPAERDSARSRRDLARRVLAALDDRTATERPAH